MTDPSTRVPGRRRPAAAASTALQPTDAQRRWLLRGVDQPGGKLPLFDPQGRTVPKATIRSCLDAGWAAPWFANPTKPDWLVCRLTAEGYRAVGKEPPTGA
ncbi:hypothetical protein [Phreatobacter sp.]|uniref:hypothetical protein n=1 Tax=Phreatobacter sp. TaxID=1966341 RepID=UPI0022BACC09|nr:hypothetical protein [Phreatobacter sp.]MCZ8315156.1 hypothetical protein [Phreatobacter sp.]